jgi:ABC-2 type transport system permease protein
MRRAWLIAARELGSFVRAPSSYLIAGLVLAIDGLLFNAVAVGSEPRPSSLVLERCFEVVSGTTMVASILVAMRAIAADRGSGALVLLRMSPARSWEITLGKFVACWLFVLALIALTAHLPWLIAVRGRLAPGHVLSGYVGLMLLSAASVAIGVLGSALASRQLVAGVLGGSLLVALLLCWLLARLFDAPYSDLLAYLALWQAHVRPALRGVLALSDAVYLVSVTLVALCAASLSLRVERFE